MPSLFSGMRAVGESTLPLRDCSARWQGQPLAVFFVCRGRRAPTVPIAVMLRVEEKTFLARGAAAARDWATARQARPPSALYCRVSSRPCGKRLSRS